MEGQGQVSVSEEVAPLAPQTATTSEGQEEAREVLEKTKGAPQGEEEKKFASRFAALSRKERALVEREKQLNTRLSEIEEQAKTLGQFSEFKSKAKQNPLEALQELELSFEDIARYALNDGKKTPEEILANYQEQTKSEIEQIKAKLEEKEQKEQEALKLKQEKEISRGIEAGKQALVDYIASKPEDYELILANNAQNDVWEVIEGHFYATFDEEAGQGELLDFDEAAQKVEQYFEEVVNRHLNLKKVSSRLKPQKEEVSDDVKEMIKGVARERPAQKTITNKFTASTGVSALNKNGLSERERLQRALEKLS